jgi:hypothetical protein
VRNPNVRAALRFGLGGRDVVLCVFGFGSSAYADHVNVTGQGQQTSGAGPSNTGGEGDKPLLPGNQPAKRGPDPSSQVHNIDQRDLAGKSTKTRKKRPSNSPSGIRPSSVFKNCTCRSRFSEEAQEPRHLQN